VVTTLIVNRRECRPRSCGRSKEIATFVWIFLGQAKTLSKGQVEAVLGYLAKTRHPARNRLIFLLSVKAGLRAKEIAGLTWWMTNDSQGQIGRVICLQDSASKGKSGRTIPLSDEVRDALIEYRELVVALHREVAADFRPGHREHVSGLVPSPRVPGLLKSQWPSHFYNQCCM
jgi:integrase